MDLCTTQSDVFIVGAGPAGLACAIAAARQGLRVEVADAVKPPIDKACGEGLLPDSLEALAAVGITDLDQIETHPLRGIRFIGNQSSTGEHTTAEATFPNTPGRGIRRTVLHQILLDRANSLGIRFHWENSVQGIAPTPDGTLVHSNRQIFHTRYLIGADGPRSRVATWAGLTEESIFSRRIGLRQHYTISPWTDFVEVHWSSFGQAYVTPNSSNEVCVAYIANKKISNSAEALAHFPALSRSLARSQPNDLSRGSITLGRKLRRVTTGNIALIGDASGSVDAITGEGIALCFRQAAALSLALKADDLGLYQQAHRRIQLAPSLMSRSLLLMDRSPKLRDGVIQAFHRYPILFRRLLEVHIDHRACIFPGVDDVLATGLHLLTS
jgi:flavin-dependent dehydrogenase